MMRKVTKKCLANPTAHAMRAAALRLAREGTGEDSDPSAAYGCVDWFRYDVVPPPQPTNAAPPLAGAPAAARHGVMSSAH